jgi:hypothetical protein
MLAHSMTPQPGPPSEVMLNLVIDLRLTIPHPGETMSAFPTIRPSQRMKRLELLRRMELLDGMF